MAAKFDTKLILAFALVPPISMPLLAYLLIPEHRYWAMGIGLVLGIVLAIAAVGLMMAQNEMMAEESKKEAKANQVRQAVKGGDAVDIAIVNMQKLDEYYALNRSQARNSFAASIAAVCVGFAAILIAARFASTDPKQAIAGALGGVLLNFIGGGFFVMYNKSLEQLNLFYSKLVQLQDTMLAVQQCDQLPAKNAADVREKIILELIERPHEIRWDTRTTKHEGLKPKARRINTKQRSQQAQQAAQAQIAGAGSAAA